MKIVAGICIALLSLSALNEARAAPIANPAPAALAEDVDDSGYFTVLGNIFSIQVVDIGESLGLGGLTFGFYFEGADTSDSANLFTIFDATDALNDEAVVNFGSGIVIDVEDAAVQTVFSGAGNIGFFLTLNPFGGATVFSDPLLNVASSDYFGTFPFLVDPARFAIVARDPATGGLISLNVLNGIDPIAAKVPEPSTLLLLGFGLLGLRAVRRRAA